MVLNGPAQSPAEGTTSPSAGGERFRELDGLRGIAAIAVVLVHVTVFADDFDVAPRQWVPAVAWGEYGVQLFFLISGFVVLLTARRAGGLGLFAISRISRLYPVYWMALAVSLILSLLFPLPGSGIGWVDRIANVTMVQRLLLLDNVDPVYWTLAVEIQFYLLLGLLLVIGRGIISDRTVVGVSAGWIVLAVILGVVVRPHTLGVNPQLVATPYKILVNLLLVEHGPLFATGMLCHLARRSRTFLPLALVALPVTVLQAWIVRGLDHAVAVAVVVALFAVVVLRRRSRLLLLAPVQFYGRISYSLYLSHLSVCLVVLMLLDGLIGRDLAVLVSIPVATMVAVLYHRWGEIRGSRALRRLLLRAEARRRTKSDPLEETQGTSPGAGG